MKWVLIVGEIVSKIEAKLSPECGKMLWKYQRVSLQEVQARLPSESGLLLINTRKQVGFFTLRQSLITSGN